jgi:hypothetical protein
VVEDVSDRKKCMESERGESDIKSEKKKTHLGKKQENILLAVM